MLPREMGATQGSSTSRRTTHLPRKSLCSAMARMLERTSTRICETKAKTKVFPIAPRKLESCRAEVKFRSPMKLAVWPPSEIEVTL